MEGYSEPALAPLPECCGVPYMDEVVAMSVCLASCS